MGKWVDSFNWSKQTTVAIRVNYTPAMLLYNLVFRGWGHHAK